MPAALMIGHHFLPIYRLDELNDAMAAVFDGRQCPHMTALDTGSDTYAVIFSSSHITDADAQKVWDDTMGEVG
jgi:hypothetical protein